MPEDLRKARELFMHAVGKLPPEQWDRYVVEAAGGDSELEAQIRHLLQVHREAGSFLERPVLELGVTGRSTPARAAEMPAIASEGPGMVVGPYKLLQQIGEGGMGTVFMAEQSQPVQRQVALKIIRPGMDSRQVIGRFETERQALAMMDHPNIAKVFDTGTTVNGRPYFVMELVKGVPITDYCDQAQLTPRERLELFIPVCHAVQHAHQKGIIHRDLKPSNVLVALYDDKPVPKIIDFGVAKATGHDLTERTVFTQYGQLVGTVEYMSPEQASLNALDIDTRSDIYSLGVLLYELLTGSTPFAKKRLHEAAFDEMLRIIREEDPPTPSTRLSTTAELPAIAANRNIEPRKLSGLVRGDLDWVVMKALEKDRSRRYAMACAFATDVQHYLDNEPISACPATVLYRFRKFARRNRASLVTVAVIAFALLGGTVVSTWEAIRAIQAEKLAEKRLEAESAERQQAVKAKKEAVANFRKAREAVDQMLTRVAEQRLARMPEMERVQRDLLGDALQFYQALMEAQKNDRSLRQEIGLAHGRLGRMNRRLGQPAEAEKNLRLAIASLEALSAEGTLDLEGRAELSEFYTHLGWLLPRLGRRDEGEGAHQHALAVAERLASEFPDSPRYPKLVANACVDLGNVWSPTRPAEAEALYRRAIRLSAVADGNRHHLSRAHLALGELLISSSRLTEAEDALRQAQAILDRMVSELPHLWHCQERLADTHLQLGRVLAATGRSAEAVQAFRQAVALGEQLHAEYPAVPEDRDALVTGYADLVLQLAATGQSREAGEVYSKLMALEPESTKACHNLAWLLATCPEPRFRNPPRAVVLARRAVEVAPYSAPYWRTLGTAHYRVGDVRSAVSALEKSMDLRKGGDSFDWFFQAMAYWRLGNEEQARRWYAEAIDWMTKYRPDDDQLRRFQAEAAELLGVKAEKDLPPSQR